MKYKILLTMLLVSFFGTQWCMEEKGGFDLFAKKYAPPKEIIERIEKNKEKIRETLKLKSLWHVKDISGLYFKGLDIHRLINAERMSNCIKINNLYKLGVAKKYVYKLDGTWLVFAEKIDASKNKNT